MNFSEQTLARFAKEVAKYPADQKQSAVMACLAIVQHEQGHVSPEAETLLMFAARAVHGADFVEVVRALRGRHGEDLVRLAGHVGALQLDSLGPLDLGALVAWFWKTPYTTRLTRWGTELHDRFLLPSFVEMDFQDVIDEMGLAGYGFDPAWFAPHFEFRFPLIGEVATLGIGLTLRSALEPWHVMGEEGAIGGTVRYVDSSVERLQVKVSGYVEGRHVVLVDDVLTTGASLGALAQVVRAHGASRVEGWVVARSMAQSPSKV